MTCDHVSKSRLFLSILLLLINQFFCQVKEY